MHSCETQIVSYDEFKEQIHAIRNEVFVDEQQIDRSLEFDGLDIESVHALAWVDGKAVGTGRLHGDGHIGRMAVLKPYRRRGIGRSLLHALMTCGSQQKVPGLWLSSQADAVAFYEKAGFACQGKPFQEAGIPHLKMKLDLNGRSTDSGA